MASTYTSLKLHIVFSTRSRTATIEDPWRSELHAYVGGIIRTLGGTPLGIGGTADHVHVMTGLKATHAPADFVREVKKVSSVWAAERRNGFAWQAGYGAFSVGAQDVPRVLAYVARQEEHHRSLSSADELRALLAEHGVAFDERFFE